MMLATRSVVFSRSPSWSMRLRISALQVVGQRDAIEVSRVEPAVAHAVQGFLDVEGVALRARHQRVDQPPRRARRRGRIELRELGPDRLLGLGPVSSLSSIRVNCGSASRREPWPALHCDGR